MADPLWMLGRQWQLGEHAGEDAGAPVAVRMTVAHTPIEPVDGLDPTVVPAEAIIEGTAADWWTLGRRIRVGPGGRRTLTAAQREAVPVHGVAAGAVRRRASNGEVDGLEAWRSGLVPADHPRLDGLDRGRRDHWDPPALRHDLDLPAGAAHADGRATTPAATSTGTPSTATEPVGHGRRPPAPR